MENRKMFLALVVAVAFAAGCAKEEGESDTTDSMSELASGVIAGSAQGTEGSGSFALVAPNPFTRFALNALESTVLPRTASADGQCPLLRDVSCNGAVAELVLNNCVRGVAVWNAVETSTFDSNATCQARFSGNYIPTSGSVVRLWDDGSKREGYFRSITFYTNDAAGYSFPVSGGTQVTFGESAGTPTRSIEILGFRHVGTSLRRNVKLWDISVSTAVGQPLAVVGVGASRQVQSGTVVAQHNLAQYTAETSVVAPLVFQAGCCHPVGGTISTTFTGSRTGSETLRFGASCGSAALEASDGSSANVALRHCF